jgi:hypothetical protein
MVLRAATTSVLDGSARQFYADVILVRENTRYPLEVGHVVV